MAFLATWIGTSCNAASGCDPRLVRFAWHEVAPRRLCGFFSLFLLNEREYTANKSTGGADRIRCWSPPRVFWETFSGKGFSIMGRKIAIAVGAVLLGLVIVSATNVGTRLHVKWNDTCAWLDRKLPVEA